jgi:adenosine deaminase
LQLTQQDIYRLARHAFQAAFLSAADKQRFLDEIEQYMADAAPENLE